MRRALSHRMDREVHAWWLAELEWRRAGRPKTGVATRLPDPSAVPSPPQSPPHRDHTHARSIVELHHLRAHDQTLAA